MTTPITPLKQRPTQSRLQMFVPLLYFLEGVPYVVVTAISVLIFKDLGVDNTRTALFTTLVALPWTFKMLWGPIVDGFGTKRRWIIATQCLLVLAMVAIIIAFNQANFLAIALSVFVITAFLSATHDIAADGFYLLALNEANQAFYVGIRSMFYRLATIFSSGFLVWFAGKLIELKPGMTEWTLTDAKGVVTGSSPVSSFWLKIRDFDESLAGMLPNDKLRAWSIALGLGAAVYTLFLIINAFVMPKPKSDLPSSQRDADHPDHKGETVPWADAFRTYFTQDRIVWILAFILFYRFGESMISKLSPMFLKDPASKGGLEVATSDIGRIMGIWGVVALTVGGLLGGAVIAKFGIKKSLWPMVLSLNVPNLFYVYAAYTHPGMDVVTWLIAVDQFGYGFGFSAYMVYLMFVSQGSRFETSHYAISTGLMALGVMVAGAVSGWLSDALGYAKFFVVVCLCTIPGMITLFFIPLDRQDIKRAQIDID